MHEWNGRGAPENVIATESTTFSLVLISTQTSRRMDDLLSDCQCSCIVLHRIALALISLLIHKRYHGKCLERYSGLCYTY